MGGEGLGADLRKQLAARGFLNRCKPGCQSSLKRKSPQQGLAKGVYGLNGQTPWRIQNLFIKAINPVPNLPRNRLWGLYPHQADQQVRSRLPLGQGEIAGQGNDTLRHFLSGGAGIGQRQDAGGRCALQQQT